MEESAVAVYHHWFRSGSHSLLGHLDLPEGQTAHSGLLIVSPFGWEDVCSYRPLRSMARRFALRGVPTLRFDLPGTGDSSGSALDAQLLPAWIRSVKDAAAELRAQAGVQSVSILGIRLGAMLALAAASSGEPIKNLEALILWGASATGRALLRELRAFHNLEVTEYEEGEMPPPQPLPGLEVAGFLLNPETESAIEAFHLRDLPPMGDRRVLLLSRDSFPQDAKLVQALEKTGCRLVQETGSGYQAMMAAPHEALPNVETEALIVNFLQIENTGRVNASPRSAREWARQAVPCKVESGVVESVCSLPYNSCSLFSIVSRPRTKTLSSDWGLLLLNAGGIRHIGPNRMWVEAARRWAARGVPSIRLDFDEVGESGDDQQPSVDSLHETDLVKQITLAMDAMSSLMYCRRFIAVGLCSGAFGAFQTAFRNPALRGAILLNPRVFFWDREIERRRLVQRVSTRVCEPSSWRRIVRGEIKPDRVKQVARVMLNRLLKSGSADSRKPRVPDVALAGALEKIKEFGSRVTIVFADNEPLFQEMADAGQLSALTEASINRIQAGKTGHTLRPTWAQRLVHDLVDHEIEMTIQQAIEAAVPKKIA